MAFILLLTPFILFAPALVSAHIIGVGQPTGFWQGFLHPFSGIDHIIISLMLGIFIALASRLSLVLRLLTVSLFVSFHSLAHPLFAYGIGYIAGFFTATFVLYLTGVFCGAFLREIRTAKIN